ncbi:hypothetical protein VE03_10284 [Pseudogymnoascus sp. 23342-1-I1]|nr:hypothetical protein VE03_10284 [Pseudogymnoascus sp. 23342-1-I1]
MSELPGYSPYGVPPPPASSSSSLAPSTSTSTAPPEHEQPTPTYTPHPPIRLPKRNMAGPIQTISLADKQHDYFQVTRTSPFTLTAPTTYCMSLTTDPTPLYRIEVDPRPTADPAIQLFDPSTPLPLAIARLAPFVPTVAAVCTRDPAGANPVWHPMGEASGMLCLEPVPGLPAVLRSVGWTYTKLTSHLTCTLMGSLFGIADDDTVLARYGMMGRGRFSADMVFEVLRGGGLEFELAVVMQVFTKLEADRRRNAKKAKKR